MSNLVKTVLVIGLQCDHTISKEKNKDDIFCKQDIFSIISTEVVVEMERCILVSCNKGETK